MPSRATVAASVRRPAAFKSIGAVEDRAQHNDQVAGLGGEANRRLQLGEPGVRLAEVDEGAAQRGVGVGLLGPGADSFGDGDGLLGRPLASAKWSTFSRYCASEPSTHARSTDGAGGTSRTACCCASSAAGSPSRRRQRASCSCNSPARSGWRA